MTKGSEDVIMNYAFDVDGTLSEARTRMNSQFESWFLTWMQDKNVFLVTGSDRTKTVEQIGTTIVDNCTMVFQCAGNSVWQRGVEISATDLNPPRNMFGFLEQEVANSPYPHKYGEHIEKRTGLINFSIVGRSAVGEQRDDYYAWDNIHHERTAIANRFNNTFPGFEAEVGGNTSLDIHLKGRNKAQVYDVIGAPMVFFGDRMYPGGNDYPLKNRMIHPLDRVHPVTSAEQTWQLLKDHYNE